MKYVKMLGLAAVAAAALMAFVGASSASATVLCTTKVGNGPCPAAWILPAGSELHAASETEKPTLTSTFKTITCNESTVGGKTSNAGSASETVKGPVETLTFTGSCTCTVAVLKTGTLEIHASGGGNGTLTSNGAEVTVQCSSIFGPVHCIYVTENKDLGTLTGSSTTGGQATMDITTEVKRAKTTTEGTLCDEEAIWHAKYTITNHTTLDVAES
jgi:hypothetical protein